MIALLSKVQAWLRPDPQVILNAAISRAAQLHGELQEARTRHSYYGVLVIRCDPHREWWRFAALKQRMHDAGEDVDELYVAWERAAGDVKALMEAQR